MTENIAIFTRKVTETSRITFFRYTLRDSCPKDIPVY